MPPTRARFGDTPRSGTKAAIASPTRRHVMALGALPRHNGDRRILRPRELRPDAACGTLV